MAPKSNPPKLLYHYCPSDSFFGIATSKNIWLSNSLYSNDPNENKISRDILIEISNESSNIKIKKFAKKVLDFKFGLIDDAGAYVFCMSQEEDDLNQWRIYGDNGYGYSLGFITEYFLNNGYWNLLDDKIIIPSIDKIYLGKCIYDYKTQRSIVEALLTLVMSIPDIEIKDRIFKLKYFLQFYSSIFKHDSYSAEKEWRLICFPVSQPQTHNVKINFKLHFRTSRGLISQYIEQPFMEKSEFKNTPFETIDLGSNIINDGHEIMNFLQFQGLHYTKRIRKSKIKMRAK